MIILKECFQQGLLSRKTWMSNVIAGIIVGIVALPLAMAFAIASGAKPEQGIYTAIVAGILVSLFGGSRVQIAGPTGAFIVILSGITAKYGMSGLQLATLMAGVMLLGMGVLRLGVVMQYIPYPVILGFTAGVALVIWVGQWPSFFGLPAITGHHFHEKLWHTLQAFPSIEGLTTLLGILGLLLTIFVPKIPGLSRVPGTLVALVVVTVIQYVGDFPNVMTIGKAYGGIPSGLPHFNWPAWTWHDCITLIGPAFSIALLGAIESLLSAVVADGMIGTKHQANQELIGQGIANIVAPLANGFAATGAIARTATNIRNGGTNPIAGVMHGITLIAILLFLAPLASNVPLTVLAAVLFVVCWNMSELPHCLHLIRTAPRSDILIMLVTFFCTVTVDLVFAVQIGVLMAVLYFFYHMSQSLDVEQHELADMEANPEATTAVFHLQGPIFFGVVENLEKVMKLRGSQVKTVVLRFGWVPMVDITAMRLLEKLIKSWHKQHITVKLSGVSSILEAHLQKSGLLKLVGPENVMGLLE
ncbi:MAG: STAS domain-containing protein [Gammaproteobacteria bacterium]|nr:STAS domain-containing protein [Gammaproteobacteria bacterium]